MTEITFELGRRDAGDAGVIRSAVVILQVFYRPDVIRPGRKEPSSVVHAGNTERLVMTGVIGVRPDGILETGMRAQMERAWLNLLETIDAAGFDKRHLLRITAYATEPGRIQLFREIADRMLDGHSCPCPYRQIQGLGIPPVLFELEAEAVRHSDENRAPTNSGQKHDGADLARVAHPGPERRHAEPVE